MAVRPPDLPDYGQPPIDEVVIGLQFAPIGGFADAMVGKFWDLVRDEFPVIRAAPRIDTPLETPGSSAPPPVVLFATGPSSTARTWLESKDGHLLLQVQNDRFIHNWRRREPPHPPYPHFESLLERFMSRWRTYSDFLSSVLSLPPPAVLQVEVNYVNWLTDMPVHQFLRPAAVATVDADEVVSPPHGQTWTGFYHVTDAGAIVGRLYAQCTPATRNEPPSGPGVQFSLSVRIPCPNLPTDELERLMLLARHAIVRTFDSLTTSEAHSVWKRSR